MKMSARLLIRAALARFGQAQPDARGTGPSATTPPVAEAGAPFFSSELGAERGLHVAFTCRPRPAVVPCPAAPLFSPEVNPCER